MQADTQSAKSPARQFAYGGSTLKIRDGIWHLRVQEAGYRESGFAIGRLLSLAEYPAVGFFMRRRVRFLVNLLYVVTRRHFASIRIPERYLEELRGYAEGSGLAY